MSEVSTFDGAYYFTTATLNQFTLTNNIHLYKYANDQLDKIEPFSGFLQYVMRFDGWIHLNDFSVDAFGNCYSLSHKAAAKKEITFVKTDTSFLKFEVKNIPLNEYAELNDLLVLKNGNIVLTSINEEGNWSYYIYDEGMVLLKEIKTSLYRKYYPTKLKETEDNHLVCLYSLDIVSDHDCVLHKVKLP